MDFGKLLDGPDTAAPTHPRELYEALPDKEPGYGYLRLVQGEVLEAWHARRAERDLVVKVNTGGGKTIDGLVILQSLLNEDLGPALYVAPGKQLVSQVIEEAKRIGIQTVEDPDDPAYTSGRAIAVVNASKLVNGKTVFSNRRPSRQPAPIGSVVIDDAHAALATVRENLSIRLGREHKAYGQLLALFRSDLDQASPTELLDIDDESYGALSEVPFWAWQSKIATARAELHKHQDTEQLRYVWPAVKDVLELCRVVFTGMEVTITPPCPPISHITEFADAKRRVYLTATLADDSVLVETFGANPESVRKPIAPPTAGDIGERMILAPQGINPGLIVEDAKAEIARLAMKHNVVVLAPSNGMAKDWARFGALVVTDGSSQVEEVVRQLRKDDEHVGLVAFANRYDGIDLPGKACRILVMDGLPEARSAEDRLETKLLRQSGTDDRQIQRIEQGMGRGVRSSEDHCVVFLLGTRLNHLVVDPRSLARFSPATQAQLKLSHQMAKEMERSSMAEIMKTANQALERDPTWTKLAKRVLSSVRPAPGNVSDLAIARRAAFDAAEKGDYKTAADVLEAAELKALSARQEGWLQAQRAAYVNLLDPAKAQRILASAKDKNSEVMRPLSGITYKKLDFQTDQARRASDFLEKEYGTAEELRLAFQGIVNDLVFDKDRARVDDFEEAMLQLALHLGFASQRPDFEARRGSDILWALGPSEYWVIEAKSGSNTQRIHKDCADQLSGHMNWFRERYGELVKATPVMVHKASRMHDDAAAPQRMKVLDEAGLQRFKDAVIAFSAGLAADRWDNPTALASQLEGHGLRAADLGNYLRDFIPAR
ncbi:DEAD/DEAH box helicase [Pseudonocardia bannensis]|uniref:DEAD/DEAH box helicase family protein n=1 Tax=Pseudonocardia bannensis TaxID=630973 RepID=A0A848DFW6_9PSEU|nr:helicase C-terminal domain-containing protein [Pseudonocardia bannensis]NMH91433.1 DEAD/DEAH box helicase family protein [Pseudonocardia bannensis]